MTPVHPVFFIVRDSRLAEEIINLYSQIKWEDEYKFYPSFHWAGRNNWNHQLPQTGTGLVYIQMESNDYLAESALIAQIRQWNSSLQLVLLANSDVDYFKVASESNIGNVLRIGAIDSAMLRALSIRLMTGNIFGFDPYFPNGYAIGPFHRTYSGQIELDQLIMDCFGFFIPRIPTSEPGVFKTFLHELLTNTIAYAVAGISEKQRDEQLASPPKSVFIPERKAIKVSMVADDEKTAFSVQDSAGNLRMLRVLDKLRRQSCIGGEKLPPGMWDASGRGISLIQKDSRYVLNILKGVRTETIFMHYFQQNINRFESIIITEVAPLKSG